MHKTKNITVTSVSRRKFLKSTSAAITLAAIPGPGLFFSSKKQRNKMVISFYLDDTNPERVKAGPYKDFLDYCHSSGIKGESSIILGSNGKSMVQDPDGNQRLFLTQAKESYQKGIDSHMEIMTHSELFDFEAGRINEEGIHEGLWLHEPGVTVEEYQDYFSHILKEGEKSGVKFTGLTWPGCGCAACTRRYADLRKSGPLQINKAAFDALLNLAKAGKFRSRVLSIFYESSETEFGIFKRAADGNFGVYDLMPNAKDNFGIWENSPQRVNPDYYITEDGKSGIILQHLKNNVPYCMWYMHWQGLNPGNGVGWEAFEKVTGRIRQHLKDQVVWMRPSDIVTAYHDAGGWDFTEKL